MSKCTFQDFDEFNVYICWYLLSKGKIIFTRDEIEDLLIDKSSQEEIDLLLKVSPLVRNEDNGNHHYLHKSIYEYYLALGIVKDLNLF